MAIVSKHVFAVWSFWQYLWRYAELVISSEDLIVASVGGFENVRTVVTWIGSGVQPWITCDGSHLRIFANVNFSLSALLAYTN